MLTRLFIYVPAALLLVFSAKGAPPEAGFFGREVYPVLTKAGCAACHNDTGVASGTRLHFPEGEATKEAVEAFGNSLRPLIDRASPEDSLLLKKPTKRVAHAGGLRIPPGSPEEELLRQWVVHLAALPETSPAVLGDHSPLRPARVTPVLRFLTHAQYNNTARDLLGDDTRAADQFPPEDFINGFKGQYQSQSISPLLAESYSTAAEKLAHNAFRAGDTHGLIPCKPSGSVDSACRDQFIRLFGKRAFRRPLTDEETSRYGRLFAGEATPKKSFIAGAQIVVEAMLQSPAFLARAENGTVHDWSRYETASRLSYFLWNTAPNSSLMKSAEAGALDSPEGLERVAQQMLKDPRAKTAVDEFISQWLRFDRVNGMVKDRRIFPLFTPEVALAMAEETRRLSADLVWNNGNFMKLFSADYTYINSELAAIYHLPLPAVDFQRVPLPESSGRGGITGQALFLASTSKPEETSPTARGLFVREQFLCQEVPPPPPGVNTNLPALSKEQPKTNRDRLAMHTVNESCKSCHSLIDPIGFGFEKFDAIGQKRDKLKITFFPGHGEKEDTKKTVEIDLDSTGFIAGIPQSDFSSPRQFGQVLERAPQCQECVVRQLFRYAAGRRETAADRRMLEKVSSEFRSSNFNFQALLVSLVKYMVFPSEGGKADGVSGY